MKYEIIDRKYEAYVAVEPFDSFALAREWCRKQNAGRRRYAVRPYIPSAMGV